jgi:hypothetical protein
LTTIRIIHSAVWQEFKKLVVLREFPSFGYFYPGLNVQSRSLTRPLAPWSFGSTPLREKKQRANERIGWAM